MTEYTRGPWMLAEASTTIPVRSASGKTVASVRYGPTDLYDARLIAAAPDMFDALRKIPARYMDDMDRHTPGMSQLIRAAIAKAEQGI